VQVLGPHQIFDFFDGVGAWEADFQPLRQWLGHAEILPGLGSKSRNFQLSVKFRLFDRFVNTLGAAERVKQR
jgi:hypothetical protein